ncbi:MAG: hypothetical protein FE048_03305 [Thermoplasmata archaeon]|nr:MAG: hypothetical protein FE048_03305 [Thermoplasmata archaeon]
MEIDKGMLYYLIKKIRPELAHKIKENKKIETVVVGLGRQGTRHAELMREYGTTITAGIAPGRGGTKLLETIPVYNNIEECLAEHPDIAAASIWRHYSMAKNATIEVIESGIPIVVLITEGIPIKDMQSIITSARKNNTLLIGGNTPGIIFPPERIKIGMLPDIFYPEETAKNEFGPKGVTIISRSGAILYHMSDALASAGIAQNAVIGIGGDAIIGSTFLDLVPLVMEYEHTDLVVIAGEIGGCQEEILADDIKKHPEKYPKPLVAVLSGAHAPEGKTMGHAGAIIAPGKAYGTFEAKKKAFEEAGIPVVNSQYDLIDVVKSKIGKKYFEVERYYEKMKKIWESPPKKPTWGTLITKVSPNELLVRGYPLPEIIANKNFLETAYLLIEGEFPDKQTLSEIEKIAHDASLIPAPRIMHTTQDISKTLATSLLLDSYLANFPQDGKHGHVKKTAFCLGRMARYIASLLNAEDALDKVKDDSFSHALYHALTGEKGFDEKHSRMLEAMLVACADHGVTPPSAQATIIAASTRASYEVAIANGICAITDVHGGAGAKAVKFFKECVMKGKEGDVAHAVRNVIREYMLKGKRIEGMGHRIHTKDPRRDVLWELASKMGVADQHVRISKMVSEIFKEVRGINLPINVDGVIGAIIADMGLEPIMAKAIFIYGRVAGLSAHYFEEITTQPPMRRINFADAVYKGKELRHIIL